MRTLQPEQDAIFGLAIGATGTGKSLHTRRMIPRLLRWSPRVLVLDPKGDYRNECGGLISVGDTIRWLASDAPGIVGCMIVSDIDRDYIGRAIWKYGSVFVVADEFQFYGDSTRFKSDSWRQIVTMGRSYGIKVIAVTQRLTMLPKDLLTNATDILMFRTSCNRDTKSLIDVAGDSAGRVSSLPRFRALKWGEHPELWEA